MLRKGMKLAVVLAVAAALVMGAPAEAGDLGPHERTVDVEQWDGGSFLEWAWRWVRSLWAQSGAGTKAGACIDPDGSPCTESPTNDNGAGIDPDG